MTFDRITDESISVLIHSFYAKVRSDSELGPVFYAAIGDNWDAHLSKMSDFWGAAMRISSRYRGDMLAAHRRVKGIHPALIGRWLDLFEQTAAEHFSAGPCAALCDRAQKTAYNLQLALFHRRDHGPIAPRPDGKSGAIRRESTTSGRPA